MVWRCYCWWCGERKETTRAEDSRWRELTRNEGVDIDEYDRKIFPLYPTDAENEEHYDYGAGVDGVDDDIPVIINDDENYSFENNEVVISSDADDEMSSCEVLREEEEVVAVQDMPPTEAGTRQISRFCSQTRTR